ncbi:hypothetical protein Gotur_029416 [Gossypium turneri]
MKTAGVTRLDSIKQAILLFANSKLSIEPEYRLLATVFTKLQTLSTSNHVSVVSINMFVALLCACIVIGHLLEENRWMNESITALIMVKKKQFFCNFITIMLFGAVGTLVSCTIISLGISNDLMEAIYSSANVLKRSTSVHWNKNQQSGFKSMKKKIQGAINEIRNVAR